MKQANNNEVDLLLRSLARGREGVRSQSGSSSEEGLLSDHLDADELNSYAEGAVPSPARARYIEHLADCQACRGIVVSLTQAAGGSHEVHKQEGGSNFWQSLGALFSPTVLRFAVPALVLTVVIGIGFLVLKQQGQSQYVARNNGENAAPPSTRSGNAGTTPNPSTGATLPSAAEVSPTTKVGSEKEEKALQGEKGQVAQGQVASTESTVAKPLALKDSAQPGEGADTITTRTYASEPKAASPPASVLGAEIDKSAELAKERPAKRADQQVNRDEVSRSREEVRNQPTDDDGHGPYRSRNNTALPSTNERNAGLAGGRGPSADKKKVSAVETRSVSGRRFIREDDVWVDTDYKAPRSTTRIVRGSDQFRALVADEPGLRAIANELNGAVIVIWKGRAYRIQ